MSVNPSPDPVDRPAGPSVSVIVPVYNGAHVLRTTVPAMLAQDAPAEWLFIDDGSTDDTAVVLQAVLEEHAPTAQGMVIRVLTHPSNRGRAAARNTGIRAATGSVLVFLDADMAPRPDFLSAHLRIHGVPGVVGAVSRGVLADYDSRNPFHRYLASTRRGAATIGPDRALPFRYFIIGYTSIRADAVAEIGSLDEELRYGEDLDFAVRLARRFPDGLRYAPNAVAVQHDTGELDRALAVWRAFGREGVPRLLARHPELTSALGGAFVHSSRPSLRRAAGALLLRDAPARVVQRFLHVLPSPLDFLAVRYLLGTALAEGVRAARRFPTRL